MGRSEPTVVKPPAAFRRDARAKQARATINKVIPALLSAHPRARRGIESSELIVDPPPLNRREDEGDQGKKGVDSTHNDVNDVKGGRKGPNARSGGRRKRNRNSNSNSDEHSPEKNAPPDEIRAKSNGLPMNGSCASAPRITLCVADTLTAAHSLLDAEPLSAQQQQHASPEERTGKTSRAPDTKHKIGILNMASPLSPGGGFLNGATSQEETLCMRTTLLPALRDEFYRLPELGVVYTPDVLVFRPSPSGGGGTDESDILPKNARWFVDVASAAMLRLPDTEEEDGRYARAADRELAVRKMRAVLRVFAARGCARVVLGAWGCGAYGNPVAEIAGAWRRALGLGLRPDDGEVEGVDSHGADGGKGKGGKDKKPRRREAEAWGAHIDEVVFAIKDSGTAASFARAFGEDILPLPLTTSDGSRSSTAGYEDADPVHAARVRELREKIAQVETQLEQVVRSPHLRVGLEALLASLRKQLLPEDAEGGDEDEDEDEASSAQAWECSDDDEND
ncbi:hypothetical protein F5X98DRAFT_288369 [Xylaria grammica]|nr:hypothetical protein F5X98DRAFT_288369 [Xylaria grammica]